MPDFSSLLAKPVDEIKKPVPLPEGSYSGILTSGRFDEADTKEGKKPVWNCKVKLSEAMDDVDQADLNESLAGEPLSSKPEQNYTFWLTPDAQYRVIEFAQSCGLSTEGKTLGQVIQELPNNAVTVALVKVQSKKVGQEEVFFTNIGSIIGTGAA